MRWGWIAAVCVAITATAASAERVAIRLGDPLERFDKLRPGSRTYLRYTISADGVPEAIDIQTKTVAFEQKDGKRLVRIVQRWDGPKGSLRLDSLAEAGTLRPLTHQRDLHKDGTVRREGFRFLPGKIVGIAGQPDNIRKDFAVVSPVPAFNFEIDLETFATLPLRKGAEFEIPFYHPGGEAPAPYLFKVAGEETVAFAGQPIDCWVMTTDYNQPGSALTRIWIAKDNQVAIRVHTPNPKGGAWVKALVAAP